MFLLAMRVPFFTKPRRAATNSLSCSRAGSGKGVTSGSRKGPNCAPDARVDRVSLGVHTKRLREAPGSQSCPQTTKANDEALRPTAINCNRLASIGYKVVGMLERQVCAPWLNNLADNSHQPFRRRRARAAARFRDIKLSKNSLPSMHQSTITSTRTSISTGETFSNRTALLLWPSGVNSPRKSLDHF